MKPKEQAPLLALASSFATGGDYAALMKPRVMSLVIFTAFVGLVTASRGMDPILAFAALVSLSLGAGAAGALNMWYDADIDAIMRRTRKRPVPLGLIAPQEALGLGIVISIMAVVLMLLTANPLAAGLLAFSIFFYAVIYTMWLKRRTPQNIVIGGAAGAFPPLIMQAAATGEITASGVVMFLIIFIWTPPHFWALSLYARADYEAASIPMLPNIAGARATRHHIMLYSILLALVASLPCWIGMAGWLYGAVAFGLNATFLAGAGRVLRARSGDQAADSVSATNTPDPPAGDIRPARQLFAFSIFYLFALFSTFVIERLANIPAFSPKLFLPFLSY